MEKNYFECPTQVMFYDLDTEDYVGGIAYGSEIICGECGGIIYIDELIEDVREQAPDKAPIKELSWVNISKEIMGEEDA
jgi:hypothetical protein